jgi:hypothetical protein
MKGQAAFLFSLAAGISVTGCGGGSSTATPAAMAMVGGTAAGVSSGLGLLLVNNGTDTINVTASGSFSFDKKVQANSPYNVTLFRQPTGAACKVANGTGIINANGDSITNISVSCEPGAIALLNYNVGVTVSGMTAGSTATFVHNGEDTLTVNGNGLFVFPKTYAFEVAPAQGAYSVTVSANPTGQTCTLTNTVETNRPPTFQNFVNVIATCK